MMDTSLRWYDEVAAGMTGWRWDDEVGAGMTRWVLA
jgi:hypothetical protein